VQISAVLVSSAWKLAFTSSGVPVGIASRVAAVNDLRKSVSYLFPSQEQAPPLPSVGAIPCEDALSFRQVRLWACKFGCARTEFVEYRPQQQRRS
jgi:hypothetical protein